MVAERCVLVVGTPRSGTTWVGEALGRTPGACYVHEPDNHRHAPFALRAKRGLGAFPLLERDTTPPAPYVVLWTAAFGGAVPTAAAGGPLAQRLQPRVPEADAYVAGSPRPSRATLAAWRARPPAPPSPPPHAVVVKSVNAMLSLDWLVSRWQPAVLLVERHPLNVLASWLAMEFDETAALGPRVLAHARARWGVRPPDAGTPRVKRLAWGIGCLTAAVREAGERIPSVRIEHERLCEDPVLRLADVAQRLGLPWSDDAAAWVEASNRPGEGYETNRVATEQAAKWRGLAEADVEAALETLAAFPLGELGERPRDVVG